MADAKIEAAWWKANKAKTLSDSGDTVEKALKATEAALKRAKTEHATFAVEDYVKVLNKLDQAAATLEKKANKTLHKETIGYLKTFQTEAERRAKLANKVNAVLDRIERLTVADAMKMKEFGPLAKKHSCEECYLFMYAWEKFGRKPNEKLLGSFIGQKAPHEVNLPGSIAKTLTATGGAWDRAADEVERQLNEYVLVHLQDGLAEKAIKDLQ